MAAAVPTTDRAGKVCVEVAARVGFLAAAVPVTDRVGNVWVDVAAIVGFLAETAAVALWLAGAVAIAKPELNPDENAAPDCTAGPAAAVTVGFGAVAVAVTVRAGGEGAAVAEIVGFETEAEPLTFCAATLPAIFRESREIA